MNSSDDGGYVHDPSAFDEDGERTAAANGETDAANGETDADKPAHPETADREFDWRGWVVVGMVIMAFIVAPGLILLWPPDVGYRFALLTLPLFPAFFLALAAVWGTTRP